MKINKIKTLVLAVALCLFGEMSAQAQSSSFVQGGIRYNILDSYRKTCGVTANIDETIGASNYSGVIEIPRTVLYLGKFYTVTRIGKGAFSKSSKLVAVKCPSTVPLRR